MCYDNVGLIVVALSNTCHDLKVIKDLENWDKRGNEALEPTYA